MKTWIWIIKACLVTSLLLAAQPARLQAQSFAESSPADFSFEGLSFGEPPSGDMLCFRGDCAGYPQSTTAHAPESILSSYMRRLDLTHLGRTPVTSPQYDFFNDRLVRISIRTECPEEQIAACLEDVIISLDARYGLTLLRKGATEPAGSLTGLYQTDSGEVVSVKAIDGLERQRIIAIQIYNHRLMDELRKAANPNYQPSPLPAPYSNADY